MQFNEILRKLMQDMGYSNYRLAQLLDISQSTVSYWLDGKGLPQRSKKKQLADLFGVSVDYLMGEEAITPDPGEGVGRQESPVDINEFLRSFSELHPEEQQRLFHAVQLLSKSGSDSSHLLELFEKALDNQQ